MRFKKLAVLCLVLFSFSTISAVASQSPKKLKVYLSASLFNERETRFNLEFARSLAKQGYDVVLPQRDGFEYKALGAAIRSKLPSTSVRAAAADVIYILNLGKLIPQSDVVIADLDQPIDEGVVVELTYAHLIGKPVIGIRTDLRSPYNEDTSLFGGVHSFVSYQCDAIINQHQLIRNEADMSQSMAALTGALAAQLKSINPSSNVLPSYAMSNPSVAHLSQAASILFDGVQNIHSQQGVSEVVNRMASNQSRLSALNFGFRPV